MFLKW